MLDECLVLKNQNNNVKMACLRRPASSRLVAPNCAVLKVIFVLNPAECSKIRLALIVCACVSFDVAQLPGVQPAMVTPEQDMAQERPFPGSITHVRLPHLYWHTSKAFPASPCVATHWHLEAICGGLAWRRARQLLGTSAA